MELVIITGLLFCWTLLAAFGEVITTKSWPREAFKYLAVDRFLAFPAPKVARYLAHRDFI
jgi:hypothetical protein